MPLDDIVSVQRRTSNRAFDPRYSRARELHSRSDGERRVRASLPFWFPMSVPFSSQVGQNVSATFEGKNFDLEMRAAWTDLVAPRVVFSDTSYGLIWSNEQAPLLAYAGQKELTHPLKYLRRPYLLLANSMLRGNFIDDSGAEVAGKVIWACERPDKEVVVKVTASREWEWVIDLGLTGGPTSTGRAKTQPVAEDILIYGAISTSSGALVRILDDATNEGWSDDKLPVGAFAGIQGEISPVVWYPEPYYVKRNTSMIIEWQNSGSETGKFFTFICERIIRAGSQADTPTPVTPVSPTPVNPVNPVTPQPPVQQQPQPGGYPNQSPVAVAVIPVGTQMTDGSVTTEVMIVEVWADGSRTIRPRQPWE